MIVVMKPDTTTLEIERVSQELQSCNITPEKIVGTHATVIGLVGDTAALNPLQIQQLSPFIEKVMRVDKPFKRVALEFRNGEPSTVLTETPNGFVAFGQNLPIVPIAGPCSVENEEMILETARRVKAAGAKFLRGGAYKPRTSPYSFQGHGEEALRWLAKARETTSIWRESPMIFDTYCYTTKGGVDVSRYSTETLIEIATDEVLSCLDYQRGGLLTSSYEYPGRYKRWAIGFVNPPLEVFTSDRSFTIKAHNERGMVLLPFLAECLSKRSQLQAVQGTPPLHGGACLDFVNWDKDQITGSVRPTERFFSEEERSKQPSVFRVVREILSAFDSSEDDHLGLYGAFGYDLVFQFESMPKRLKRSPDQRDMLLYLPDELVIVDYYLQRAFRLQYEFETKYGSTRGLSRSGEVINYKGKCLTPTQSSDHERGEYANQVEKALDYFSRGDLFEVVPSQSFFEACDKSPAKLFRTLQQINPSPYAFIFNLYQITLSMV